ncbi:hypothetical protein [Thiohalocapsa halophila]|uniref:hypothetical protein n=1 Tax=Thiohalocapsa halophila TaxID=69359 RepID=UPI001903235B|nr:hypothetical protein [Thiohalocapsa halophila]
MKPLISAVADPKDEQRNRVHANALATISAFMGNHPWSYAEFLYGELVSGWMMPF